MRLRLQTVGPPLPQGLRARRGVGITPNPAAAEGEVGQQRIDTPAPRQPPVRRLVPADGRADQEDALAGPVGSPDLGFRRHETEVDPVGVGVGQGRGPTLRASQLQPLLAEAVTRWQAAGVDTSALAGVEVRVADLPGSTLGTADAGAGVIWLDVDAAGWGWYVDATPGDDGESCRNRPQRPAW
jgi:hypothetical protein